jgi:hypothetical protein
MWIDPYRQGCCLNVSASKIDAVYVLEALLPQLPDTTRRLTGHARWQRQGPVAPIELT